MALVQIRSMEFTTAIIRHLKAASYLELSALALAVIFTISYATSSETPKPVGAPFAPKKWRFEPSFVQRLRFTTQARHVLQEAYDKCFCGLTFRGGNLQYKDRIFIIPRVDRDITIMPFKYLDEMRSMPRSVMNATNPQALNLCAQYTYVDFLFHTDMLLSSVNKKLIPNLNKYVDWAKEEMNEAFHSTMPRPDDWIELDIQDKIHEIVSRMSARVFLGQAVAQDREWIYICVRFTNELFSTGFILKHFPEWLRPVIAPLIPNRWRLRQCVKKGEKIVSSQIKTHQDAIDNDVPPEDTLLGWMLDNGTEVDRGLTRMTQLQLLLMLAGIHTTTMAVANVLFDLCTHAEWVPVLRKEIEDVTAEYGPVGSRPDISAKVWLTKLEKMDSFLIESQRFEPSTQLKPARAMLQDVTLKDGTHLPRGTMIAWAGHQHVHDPAVNPDPHVFDPLRSYRKRYANDKAEYNKYVAGQNESTSLAFGYGNQACPGRYFAINEIKLMLSRLLVEYEWKLPDGTTRPQSFDIEENLVLQPHCKIMMRSIKV